MSIFIRVGAEGIRSHAIRGPGNRGLEIRGHIYSGPWSFGAVGIGATCVGAVGIGATCVGAVGIKALQFGAEVTNHFYIDFKYGILTKLVRKGDGLGNVNFQIFSLNCWLCLQATQSPSKNWKVFCVPFKKATENGYPIYLYTLLNWNFCVFHI